MIKTRNFKNKTLLKMTALVLFPFSLFGGIALTHNQKAHATETSYSYKTMHEEKANFSNPSFKIPR